jgi:hypothetical protein
MLEVELDEESAGAAGAVVLESAGAPGEVDCCFEQATRASALMHNKRRLRFIDHLTVGRGQTAAAPLQCRVGLNVPTQVAFHRSILYPRQARGYGGESYFLAAMRFFFLAGSFGRDLPNEP